MLDDLTEDTSITTTDDEDLLWVGVRVHGQVGDHLLVCELIALSALNDVVEDEDVSVVGGLEDEDVLVLGLLVVEDILDLEGHSLSWPHVGDLTEPSVLRYMLALVLEHRWYVCCLRSRLQGSYESCVTTIHPHRTACGSVSDSV